MHDGSSVYVRELNVSEDDALKLLNKFTRHGAVPEPLRIARLLARSLMKSNYGLNLTAKQRS